MEVRENVIILAAHGSAHPRAASALEAFAARAGAAHPGSRVVLAHTAPPRQCGHGATAMPRLEDVLAGLPGSSDVTACSLHVIAGGEFERMRSVLEAHSARTGGRVRLSGPLLASPEDAPGVATALAEDLRPALAGEPGRAAVLMGHGTTHAAQELYRALAAELANALPGARLGVLEAADPGDPLSIWAIARSLKDAGAKSALLVPLLTVAGRHAHKDLAGDQPGSWKSVLEGQGVSCRADLAGLIERERFASLWLARVE